MSTGRWWLRGQAEISLEVKQDGLIFSYSTLMRFCSFLLLCETRLLWKAILGQMWSELAFHALSEWQEFHSWNTSRRPIAASVAIAYILWFLEMHPQGPSCLFAAGRHWLLVSLEWAPDRFFIFTTVIWLYLLGMLRPEQRLDLCFGMGASGGSHGLKSIQHYPIILILASQWWKQQMPVGIMGHFMAQTVHLNTVHVRLQTRTSLKLFMYHSTSQVCSLLYWAQDKRENIWTGIISAEVWWKCILVI